MTKIEEKKQKETKENGSFQHGKKTFEHSPERL
jgi:hypothetical protein